MAADLGDIGVTVEELTDEVRDRVAAAANSVAEADVGSLEALAEDVADHPAARDVVREAAAIGTLLTLAGNEGADMAARTAAMKVLYHCSVDNEQNPSVIAAEGGVAVLASAIGGDSAFDGAAKVDAVGTLFNVTSFLADSSEAIADSVVVQAVVNLLQTAESGDGRTWAAGTLQNLAGGHPAHRSAIGSSPGAVGALLKTVIAEDTGHDTRRIATAALYNLTIDSPENQEAILASGGADTLVLLLKAGVATQHGAEAGAAATSGDGEEDDSGAPSFIVGVNTVAYAAGALQNLSFDRVGVQQSVFDNGGVAALLELLALGMPEPSGADGTPVDIAEEEAILSFGEMRTNAAGALFNITGGHNAAIDEYIHSAQGVPVLLDALVSSDPEMLTNVAGVLFNMTCDHDNNRAMVTQEDGVPTLLAVMEQPEPEAIAWAAGALFNISKVGPLCDAIAKAGGVPILVDAMAQTLDGRVATWSAGVLNNMAKFSDEMCKEIVDSEGVDPLIYLAVQEDGEQEDMVTYSTECLNTLADRNRVWRRLIVDKGGGEIVNATLLEVCCGC